MSPVQVMPIRKRTADPLLRRGAGNPTLPEQPGKEKLPERGLKSRRDLPDADGNSVQPVVEYSAGSSIIQAMIPLKNPTHGADALIPQYGSNAAR